MADVSGYIIEPSVYGFCADFIITGGGITKAQGDEWYVQDVCLGSSLIYVNGFLEASIAAGSGAASLVYVDGSLAARDASITVLFNYDAIQDVSIETGRIYDIVQDGSILLLKEYDAIQDASIQAASLITIDYVDGSLAARDASITILFNYDAIQDSSILTLEIDITRIDAYNAIQDSSIFTLESDITRIDAYDAIQDVSIKANEDDIVRIDAYDAIQDSSISTLESDITRIDAYDVIQDVSIAAGENYDSIQDTSILTLKEYDAIQDSSILIGSSLIPYVDGSLAERDASITVLFNQNAIQDVSIAELDSSVDFLFENPAAYSLEDLTDVSIVGKADEDIISYNASTGKWENEITVDLEDYFYTQNYIDGSLAAIDASITELINHDIIQDASIQSNVDDIVRIDAYDAIQDSSISTLETDKLNNTGPDTFTGLLTVDGSLMIYGDVYQDGSTYIVHAEEIYTAADFITLREGAVAGLVDPSISGLRVLIPDGANNVILGTGSDAVMRIGWEGDILEAIATREDSPIDTWFTYWDDASTMLKTYNLVGYIDGSLNLRDVEIADLVIYDGIQDVSIQANADDIVRIDAYDAIQDVSIKANADDIVRIDAYDAIQDVSIKGNEDDIVRIDAYDAVQDTSILTNTGDIAVLDASIVRLDDYNLLQDASIYALDLSKVSKAGDSMSGDLSINAYLYTEAIGYIDTAPPAVEFEGLTWWNQDDHTLNIVTGLGPTLQVGQEEYILIYNNTGDTLVNGRAVYGTNGVTDGYPEVEYAKADTFETLNGNIAVTTQDILNGSKGFVTIKGKVRDVDTSYLTPGYIYVSDISAGYFTNTRPEFPSYSIEMGSCLDSSTTGTLLISQSSYVTSTFDNFWNGVFREPFNMDVSTDDGGTEVIATITPKDGSIVLTTIFSDGFTTWPDASIVLTAGTDVNPQINFIYIPESTKVLTISTSDWPTTVEHLKVGTVVLQTTSSTLADGALKNQNWNDEVQGETGQGHLSHITERIRQNNAEWDSGAEGSMFISDTDDVYFSNTSGVVYQMHRQTFPTFDMSTGDNMYVVNNDASAYLNILNINGQILDALGNSLQNTSFSFVVWGIASSKTSDCQLMLNLPIGSYGFISPGDAVTDALSYSVFTIPKDFRGTGFLIGRYTFTYKTGAWVLYDSEDLRGTLPNISAGGGGGGGGVTSFLGLTDTPATYVDFGLQTLRVNIGETAVEFGQDPSLAAGVAQLDASVIRLDAYDVIQDASIASGAGAPSNLYELNDVSVSFPGIEDQTLAFNVDASEWINKTLVDTSLYSVVDASDYFWILADTSIDYSTIVQDQTLAYQTDGSVWENKTLVDASLYSVVDASLFYARRLQIETKTGTADGSIGDWSLDSDYLYLCVADSSWNRVAITGF